MPKLELGHHESTGLSGNEHKLAIARQDIDIDTSTAILAGFDYMVGNELLHFSYDAFDQQNFADTANACLALRSGVSGVPSSVMWNAYTADGELLRLDLTPEDFLALYINGALTHKASCMAVGGAQKEALSA